MALDRAFVDAAVAADDCRNPLAQLGRVEDLAQHYPVVVRVNVDKTRREHQSIPIHCVPCHIVRVANRNPGPVRAPQ